MKNEQEKNAGRITDPVTGPAVLSAPILSTFFNNPTDTQEWTELEGKVGKKADVAMVILAGGSGERFGRPGGKQLLKIFGKPVLSWAIEAFDAVEQVGHIVLVIPEDHFDEYIQEAVEPYGFVTPITYAKAGMIRQVSSMNGINAVPTEFKFIGIHDGARPLITPEVITHAINVLKGSVDSDGVIVGHPAIDTMKVIDGDTVVGTPDRSMFWIAQTPQIFHATICRSAHAAAIGEGYIGTDDSSLIERIGGKVLLVNSPRDNIKVTVPEDLGPVTAALERRLCDR
ncbi:MAG: 2-C-methyl-D-erythritol 4-phosphate cytidylyltransferase [Coriobacteriia bacterium]|nr:2-C-methyl-D-erythritol 4-phosphate cytidylyltransferase [Coriobacteriia bacterium]